MTTHHTFQMPSRQVPVVAEPDVCVVGGGAAGLSAAIGAARCGAEVLLIEKYGFCGGATVAGLSGTICGLYSSGDRPEQIVFGFANEFHDALAQQGGVTEAVGFGRTKLVPHDSFVWKTVADDLLEKTGVRVLLHTDFLHAFADDAGQVHTIVARSREGEIAIHPKVVIDASGDAEVVHDVSGQTTMGDGGTVQTPTMIFRLGNVAVNRFLQVDPAEIVERVTEADADGRYRLPRHHVYAFAMPNGHELLCNMTRITWPDGSTPVGIRSADLTFAEIEGRRQAKEYARFLRDHIAGCERAYLVDTGTQVGIRQTRSIIGRYRLTNADVLQARKHKSPVTCSAWPIEAHGSAAGGVKIVYLEDDTYDLPFEALVPTSGVNLLVAGRCLCAEHEALASVRVTAQCFGMGYAAGAAGTLMLREDLSSQAVTGSDVATWMKQHGLKTASES